MNLPYSLLSVRYQQKPHDETYTKRPRIYLPENSDRYPVVLEKVPQWIEPSPACANSTVSMKSKIRVNGAGYIRKLLAQRA